MSALGRGEGSFTIVPADFVDVRRSDDATTRVFGVRHLVGPVEHEQDALILEDEVGGIGRVGAVGSWLIGLRQQPANC